MDEEDIVAKGAWCLVCQFLEDDEDVVGDRCQSCGCPASNHQQVKVVAINDGD